MTDKVPLYRALSKLGYTSRTDAMNMITAGEIAVDGIPCRDPGCVVSIQTSRISHKGKTLQREPLRVLLLYKPKGIITSRNDEKGRPTIYSLLPAEYLNLHCVGRLDFATSGLLLLTNNTGVSSWLTDPCNRVARVYVVTVRGLVTPEKSQRMLEGITDKGQLLKSGAVIIRKSSRRESHLVLTLTEGKNREIRRLCESIGNEVTRLKRVSYGPLTLGNLAPGEFREIGREELCRAFPQLEEEYLL